MKNLIIYFLVFNFMAVSIWSCSGNGDDPKPTKNTVVNILVKNTEGNYEANTQVYLFSSSSSIDPKNALKILVTDSQGKASFKIDEISGVSGGSTVYFKVLEEIKLNEYNSLGSVNVTIIEGKTIESSITISERSQYGYLPSTITSALAMSEYNRWKNTQVVTCGGGLRVVAEPTSNTLVEAVGFGMLLSAYAEDKATFDGIFNFYKSKRTSEANNMMAWSVTCNGINDPGSATDGDIDVAFALIVASKHWGNTYLESAKEIINIIRNSLIVSCTVNGESIYILAPGYSSGAWGGCEMTDLMYHTPAFFRIFATVTGDSVWSELADDTYSLLNASVNSTTGLVPDWQTASGTPGPGGRVGYFGYDACRAPWRLSLDYLWNGNTKAKDWAGKISGWAEGVGPSNIVDGYELDGTPIGTNGLNSSFLGGFTVAAMTHSKARVDNFGSVLSGLNDTYWFNLNTRCLYLFTLSGDFYHPLKK